MSSLRFRRGWEIIPQSAVTPESVYLNRRSILKAVVGLAPINSIRTPSFLAQPTEENGIPASWSKSWGPYFPAHRNPLFDASEEVTDERIVTGYNNFFEFSREKTEVRKLVGSFRCNPWQVEVKGEILKPGKLDLDDLIRVSDLEERIYHFRCVEAFSMNVPWTGYPLYRLIARLEPTGKAKWIRFKTVYRPGQMPGQLTERYPWPYFEGLSMEEAMNELAFLSFGLYGHPLNKQNGAPVRLVLPWKYGFKSIKSISQIEFVKNRPRTFWSDASREYGFWGNIHPDYAHPRWSQKTELLLNTRERIPTQVYNGYGEYVAGLYDETDRRYFF